MPLNRKINRGVRAFHDFLCATKKSPFVWGANDCALFAANAVLAITGTDIAADFRGKYTDEAGAFALIEKVTGGKTVEDAAAWCATKAGLVEWDFPLKAQRGDLVVIENVDGSLIAGVVHLNGRHAVSVGDAGRIPFSIRNVKRAWQV